MSPRKMIVDHEACRRTRQILDRVGDKWSALVIGRLMDGPVRFNEMRRSIDGISQRMLTLTLKGLERDGLLTRTVTPTVPLRVDYALTPLGRTLLPVVMQLHQWAEKNASRIEKAREAYDGAQAALMKRDRPGLERKKAGLSAD